MSTCQHHLTTLGHILENTLSTVDLFHVDEVVLILWSKKKEISLRPILTTKSIILHNWMVPRCVAKFLAVDRQTDRYQRCNKISFTESENTKITIKVVRFKKNMATIIPVNLESMLCSSFLFQNLFERLFQLFRKAQ